MLQQSTVKSKPSINSTYAGYPIGGLNFPIKVAELNFIKFIPPLELAKLLRGFVIRTDLKNLSEVAETNRTWCSDHK